MIKIRMGYEDRGQFDTVEEAIAHMQDHWFSEYINGDIFILENIPLKLVVG